MTAPADTTVADQRVALRAWLARREPADDPVFVETHISIVALGRDRAWKLKKAVDFPFVNLSTAARRRYQCDREVALNRRLAPDVYLGVVPLDDASGRIVDHVVEMRRMPDARRLAVLVMSGSDASACLDATADLIARFHRTAASGPAIDARASRDAVRDLWVRNLAEVASHAPRILAPSPIERVARLAHRYLEGREPLFTRRIGDGRARDGHGDLLADDIFCLPDGPRVLDCLEFDDDLRGGDGLADVAFLAMDLERLGHAEMARRFLDRYAERSGDAWPASLEHLYIAYRALVRTKVACLRADDDPAAADAARSLLELATRHLQSATVRLILIGGPPGTGKTTLARAVAAAFGIPVLHSDEVRKELAGMPAGRHDRVGLDAGIYTAAWDARTYDALCDRARGHLETGSSVVLDASWSDPARRAQAARVAALASAEVTAIRCSVDPAVAATRAASRAAACTDASDATEPIARTLGARFADWPEAMVIDTTPAAAGVAAAAIAALRAAATR